MNQNKFYITTTLPYVNADPHIGHPLEFIQADVIARYFRQKLGAENVFLNVGTDEHGLKMYTKAKEKGQTPQEYVDYYASRWQDFCKLFQISYDNFYRTSDEAHHAAAQKFWEASNAAGDVYKKKYEGLYCVGHEAFITEKELVDGLCPEHKTKPVLHSEENYFFKLSKYKQVLLDYFDQHPEILKPAHKLNELRNVIENIEDISISRIKENLPWGVDVPNDPTQVMYVWFDALTNYVSAIGYGQDEEKLKVWWPGVQIFGPDNLRFQCMIWQGMLASVGLPFTRQFLCHGMILAADGTKMSKTVGNVVSPFEQAEKFGTEAVRYYMISEIATFGDSAYKEDDLINSFNANLANNYGNLLSRVLHLAEKDNIEINDADKVDPTFRAKVDDYVRTAEVFYESYELQQALQTANELSDFGNKYIDEQKPWEQRETGDNRSDSAQVINNLSYLLAKVTDLYAPVIPMAAAKARQALEKREKVILFPKLDI
ncbi:methionine--tRNA ligase [Candidatus Dojkabacteria bacterium]|uniref:Methionine--tRNA ligase n=1 Tax=Candidatus Dojkabacteria bacterium TaxID=2099670 RepID=A0A955I6S6_9BACT|nr:methionine--tRNA ligase [Candidatus Dojkabacteria bacterium]